MKITMCDPPSGWKYGFPKAMPSNAKDENFDVCAWLVSNGYPQSLIDSFGKHFYVRYWDEESKVTERVPVADDASMAIPYNSIYNHFGSLEWLTRYHPNMEDIRFSLAEIVASYDYLLSPNITMQEATRRLRILRKKNKENINVR